MGAKLKTDLNRREISWKKGQRNKYGNLETDGITISDLPLHQGKDQLQDSESGGGNKLKRYLNMSVRLGSDREANM